MQRLLMNYGDTGVTGVGDTGFAGGNGFAGGAGKDRKRIECLLT